MPTDPFLAIMFGDWPVLSPDYIELVDPNYVVFVLDPTVVVEHYEINGYHVNNEQVVDADVEIHVEGVLDLAS